VAPAVKIFACLDLEQNISFLDEHYLKFMEEKDFLQKNGWNIRKGNPNGCWLKNKY
jgi:hypothetical protein